MSRWSYGWAPYVPVAQKIEMAQRELSELAAKGLEVHPVALKGRTIARSFWGKGWCDHLESFSDFSNRLPRGRRYVRNGSVCHLDVQPGAVEACVAGSRPYRVSVEIKPLPGKRWRAIRDRCAGRIGSLVELIQGRLSDHVMAVVSDRDEGLFPKPGEIAFSCSCPDWASMCKHVAAVLYGVGARLDERPDLLFSLRGVDPSELIAAEGALALPAAGPGDAKRRIDPGAIEEVFGIELEEAGNGAPPSADDEDARPRGRKSRRAGRKAGRAGKKPGKKKAAGRAKAVPRIDAGAAMAAFRKACRGRGWREPEEVIVEAAAELGLAEVVHELEKPFRRLLRTAAGRGILRLENGAVGPEAKRLKDYARAELAEHLGKCVRKGTRIAREDLVRRCAVRLGYRCVRKPASALLRSALAGAVRAGIFRADGRGFVRRVR